MPSKSHAAQEEARATLRGILSPGDTVHTLLRHVARSGMSRNIACVIVRDGELRDITWLVSKALGWPVRNSGRTGEGVVVGGCGMDMGFHLVHSLCYALWPDWKGETLRAGYQLTQRWM